MNTWFFFQRSLFFLVQRARTSIAACAIIPTSLTFRIWRETRNNTKGVLGLMRIEAGWKVINELLDSSPKSCAKRYCKQEVKPCSGASLSASEELWVWATTKKRWIRINLKLGQHMGLCASTNNFSTLEDQIVLNSWCDETQQLGSINCVPRGFDPIWNVLFENEFWFPKITTWYFKEDGSGKGALAQCQRMRQSPGVKLRARENSQKRGEFPKPTKKPTRGTLERTCLKIQINTHVVFIDQFEWSILKKPLNEPCADRVDDDKTNNSLHTLRWVGGIQNSTTKACDFMTHEIEA